MTKDDSTTKMAKKHTILEEKDRSEISLKLSDSESLEGTAQGALTRKLGSDDTKNATTRESVSATTPESVSATTPPSVSATTSKSISATTLQPVAATPQSVSATTPESGSATTPQSVSATTPQSVSATTPQSVSATASKSISATTPQSVSATTRQSVSATTFQSVSATTPESVSATTSQSISATTPESISATRPPLQNTEVDMDNSCADSRNGADLRKLIADPNVLEKDWVQACHELEKRNLAAINKSKRLRKLAIVLGAGLILTSVGFAWQLCSNPPWQQNAPQASHIVAWGENGKPIRNFDTAKSDLNSFKTDLMIKIGCAMQKKGWSPIQAAKVFDVDESRIKDLLTDKPGQFTADQLILWLSALGENATAYGGESQAYHDKLSYYSQAIDLEPNNFGFYMDRAAAYEYFKQPELALKDLSKAIEVEPGRIGPWNNRALIYLQLGRLNECLSDANHIIEKQPLYESAYSLRSSVYAQQGKFDLALKDADKIIELAPNKTKGYWERANIYMRMQRKGLAAQEFRKILLLTPDDKNAKEALTKVEAS